MDSGSLNRSNRFTRPPPAGDPFSGRNASYYDINQDASQAPQRSPPIPIPNASPAAGINQGFSYHERPSSDRDSNSSGPSSNSGGSSGQSEIFTMDMASPHDREGHPSRSYGGSDQEMSRYTPPTMEGFGQSRELNLRCPYCNQIVPAREARVHAETCPQMRARSSCYDLSLPSRTQFVNPTISTLRRQGRETAWQTLRIQPMRRSTSQNQVSSQIGRRMPSDYTHLATANIPPEHGPQADHRRRRRPGYSVNSVSHSRSSNVTDSEFPGQPHNSQR